MVTIEDTIGNAVFVLLTQIGVDKENYLHMPIMGVELDLLDGPSLAFSKDANLQLLAALEAAQKELDPSFQTREELLTRLTELLNKASG